MITKQITIQTSLPLFHIQIPLFNIAVNKLEYDGIGGEGRGAGESVWVSVVLPRLS